MDRTDRLLFSTGSVDEKCSQPKFFVKWHYLQLAAVQTEFMVSFLNYRMNAVLDECIQYHDSNSCSEIYLPNLKAEENYARRFLNGKQIPVTTVEVSFPVFIKPNWKFFFVTFELFY